MRFSSAAAEGLAPARWYAAQRRAIGSRLVEVGMQQALEFGDEAQDKGKAETDGDSRDQRDVVLHWGLRHSCVARLARLCHRSRSRPTRANV